MTQSDMVDSLYQKVLATGYMAYAVSSIGTGPNPRWLRAAMCTNNPDLAEELLVAFGGAVIPLAYYFDARNFSGHERLAAWQASVLPFIDFGGGPCTCTHRFRVPGYWPPPGDAPLTNEQVVTLIQTGDLDLLAEMHARGRLVPPDKATRTSVATAFTADWVSRALLALRPDIAQWLLATFGRSSMRPMDNGQHASSLLWGVPERAAREWLEQAIKRDWQDPNPRLTTKSAAKSN